MGSLTFAAAGASTFHSERSEGEVQTAKPKLQSCPMSIAASSNPLATPRVAVTLLPIMAVVFVAFFVVGIAMLILPLHVHNGLGFGTFVVGLVAGSQFVA